VSSFVETNNIPTDDFFPLKPWLKVTHDLIKVARFDIYRKLEMWANAQRGGRPAEYRWCPLFNAAKFG